MAQGTNATRKGQNVKSDPKKLRGLRTLEFDMAELKRRSFSASSSKSNNDIPTKPVPAKERGPIAAPPKRPTQAPPIKPTQARPKPIDTPRVETQNVRPTNYREKLEKLSELEARRRAQAQAPEAKDTTAKVEMDEVTANALRSFESNRAFNEEIQREQSEKRNEPVHTQPAVSGESLKTAEETVSHQNKEADKDTETESKNLGELKIEKSEDSPKAPESKDAADEVKTEDKPEDTKKGLEKLTAEDIERELRAALSKGNEKEERKSENVTKEETPSPKPAPSIKELDDALGSLNMRITSSGSRIESLQEVKEEVTKTLEGLNERRELINENLNPIKEKERSVLEDIKKLEEEEAKAANKTEKRSIERNRWNKETERRELEDDRWRLEEIFVKLKYVIERTEQELSSVKQKLENEQNHKRDLENEVRLTTTQRDLLSKKEERRIVKEEHDKIRNNINSLKKELEDIQNREKETEEEKKKLDAMISAENDTTKRRELEEARRKAEDARRDTEETRWEKEDLLKKYFDQRDENNRTLSVLTSEVSSLEQTFNDLQNKKVEDKLKENGKEKSKTK